MTGWLLLDYGEVISLPQPAEAVAALAALAGQEPAVFGERYWRHRDAYDRGQASHAYWSDVLGRALDAGDPLVAELDMADVASWSHLNPASLRRIEELAGDGRRLALLSNAPEPLAAAIDAAPWAAAFSHRFYSCRLALAKPDSAIFERVLRELGAEPADVTFLDDRAVNVDAAAALGIDAVLFTERTGSF
ncbi:putative hydrolase of the HAD superfamily [Streptosporangium becharense]|uniref:Putative hydrolase of the HAD superfamily n=1 Tax=Streptosporangium becharense TaxID=1816182 RepID=A0A7W9IBM7_9ACTN|nr:HAD-IA family hydrolase [Streptosporangium becharense]MBB2910840.1 putative hydrolase of the HAD superfamily [Streptosporangium becharense]MBB5817535.1 putative hydrolase of the HAD superfamily [Streptosporangium becharense]